MIRTWLKSVCLVVLFVGAAYGFTEDSGKKAGKPVAEKKQPALSEADESAAMAFAREHHPELAELLTQLNTSNRAEYERAIRELSQTSLRLQRVKTQTPDRYDAALAAWKLDSRIRLLAARGSMSEDPAVEAELKAALKDRVALRLRELNAERDRLTGRLSKIEEQIKSIETNPEAAAERDLQRVKASIRKDARTDAQREKQKKKASRAAKKAKAKAKAPEKPADDTKSKTTTPDNPSSEQKKK